HLSYVRTHPTKIDTPSLHDALPIFKGALTDALARLLEVQLAPLQFKAVQLLDAAAREKVFAVGGQRRIAEAQQACGEVLERVLLDRKSTRLNSSHQIISYAVFCLKK